MLSLSTDPNVSAIQLDGQPNPACGESFYAIHPGEWRGDSADADLEELFGVSVTVTRRLGQAPLDRWGTDVWAKIVSGMDVICRKIVTAIHKNYAVLNAANAILEGESPLQGGFVEPLQFLNASALQQKGPDWFNAENLENSHRYANAGFAQTLSFGRARRVQDITMMQ